MRGYETVIGLEVHVQLGLRAKLFSPAPVAFGGEPNSRVSTVDLGLPGVLPVLNRAAVGIAIRAALALDGEINPRTRFDRKNYFYPDLPKGYQISQYEEPYCLGGRVPLGDGRFAQLERIHLEEDAGKSTHEGDGSLVDLNRAGIALIEIVGKPDLHSPGDAHAMLENLKQILQYAGVSDCDMEKGSLRCDANVSLRPNGVAELGTKVEIKNLNSFKMVQRALEYEVRRQTALLAADGTVVQETRQWNDEKGETSTMRTKESADDYRYFPDPDLPPLEIKAEFVDAIRETMPELPAARRSRYVRDFGLPEYDVDVLTADRVTGEYFEAVAAACGDAKLASNWIMTEVARALNDADTTLDRFAIRPDRLGALLRTLLAGKINRGAAKQVFEHMLGHDDDPDAVIAALGLEQISDVGQLRKIVEQVLTDNAQAVCEYRAGKDKVLHALKGRVMQATRGTAHPGTVEELLLDQLARN